MTTEEAYCKIKLFSTDQRERYKHRNTRDLGVRLADCSVKPVLQTRAV